MGMKAVLKDVSLFKDCLTSISELITEGTLEAKKDGIYLVAADPTMVSLVDFKFLSSNFDKYEIDAPTSIPINILNLVNVLKRASTGDTVTLEVGDEDTSMNITIKSNATRKFTIPLIDTATDQSLEMNLEFLATVELEGDVLKNGIDDADIASETVTLEATKEEFRMTAKGDLSSVELILRKGDPGLLKIEAKEPAKSKFSIDYLKKIMKGGKISPTARIELGNDYPVRITFTRVDEAQLAYVLAPRVEE